MAVVRLVVAVLVLASAADAARATELSAIIWRPATHPFVTHGYRALAETVARRSGGRLTISVNPPSKRFAPQAYLKALRDGAVDIAHHVATFTQDELPELALLSAIAPSLKDPLASALAVSDLAVHDGLMQARFRNLGIVFGGGYALPTQMLLCRRPVTSVAGLRGLKLRFANPLRRQWAASIGAAGVALPMSEAADALKRGHVDCIAGDAATLKERGVLSTGLSLVALNVGLEFSGLQFAMNRASWRKLAPPLRRLLLDSMAELVPAAVIANVAMAERAAREASAAGIARLEPDAALKASFDGFMARSGRQRAVTVAGTRLARADVDGLTDRFLAGYARWQNLLATVDRSDGQAVGALLRREVYDRLDERVYGLD
ncbi:MAG: TRAP transporter substrate-binding protein DctP [Hyphomicrobiaceae bacterium]